VGAATIPVPLRATVCVPAPPPALTFSVAAFDPVEVGLNTTLIVQFPPITTAVPQVLLCENWLAFAPENVMLVIGSATVPEFFTVIDFGALATLIVSLPNGTEVGETV
jgi:hypothetical protein